MLDRRTDGLFKYGVTIYAESNVKSVKTVAIYTPVKHLNRKTVDAISTAPQNYDNKEMNDVSTWKKRCYDQTSSKRRSDVSRTKKKRCGSGAGCITHEYVERRIKYLVGTSLNPYILSESLNITSNRPEKKRLYNVPG